MKDTMTAQSMRATLGYFILTDVWARLIARGDRMAADLLESLKHQLFEESDNVSYMAMRAATGWRTTDLAGWGEELDSELPEASCEGCGERVSCCQCDGGWNEARRDDDAGRTAIGNTPTCECCGKPQDACEAEQRDILAHYQDEVSE